MKQFTKILLSVGISVSSVSYYAHMAFQEHFKKQEPHYQIMHYVNENLDAIIRKQEQKLNIIHREVPTVKVGISAQTKKLFPHSLICGSYNSEENTIYLKNDIIIDAKNEIQGLEVMTSSCTIKMVLDHELGHFYCDKLSENLEKGSWPQTLLENGTVDENAIHIIREGIAEYFVRTMNIHYDYFNNEEWPKRKQDFVDKNNPSVPNYRMWYDGGYHLVKPIIDKFGVKGITYLMFHPPTEEELINLKEYQLKVIQQLQKS